MLFKYEKGHRSLVQWVRDTATPSKQWHELKLVVKGAQVTGYLNGKLYLEETLPEPVAGRVGLWSRPTASSIWMTSRSMWRGHESLPSAVHPEKVKHSLLQA